MKNKFIGVWRLVSCERKYKDGKRTFPYGEKPLGRITYDTAGRMSAQLMRPGRSSPLTGDPANGFMAYYGLFDVDESRHTVIHHVQVALIPSWVGTDLERTYRFEANRLTLTATSKESATELVWERDPA